MADVKIKIGKITLNRINYFKRGATDVFYHLPLHLFLHALLLFEETLLLDLSTHPNNFLHVPSQKTIALKEDLP